MEPVPAIALHSEPQFPPIETLVDGDIAFRQHGGGHTDGPNWPVFLDMMARYVSKKQGNDPGVTKCRIRF